MRTSPEFANIQIALSKVQAEIKTARKNADNPFFKSTYADLPEVVDACRPSLTKHGIAVIQGGRYEPGSGWILETRLAMGKEWIESDFPLATKDQNNPQAIGSAMTYAKRFSLAAMVGVVADEDDDGNDAVKEPKPQAIPQQSRPVAPAATIAGKAIPATPPQRKDPNAKATTAQHRFLYAKLKNELGIDDINGYIKRVCKLTSETELTMGGVDLVLQTLERDKADMMNRGDAFEDYPG